MDAYQHSAKSIRAQFKKQGVFYTDLKMAELLKAELGPNVHEVYDPTCGNGNLLSVFGDDVRKYGQELDAEQLKQARERLTNFQGYIGDTLQDDGFAGWKFDAIVANPPFSVAWVPNALDPRFSAAPATAPKSKADYAFVLHCLHHLSDTGRAVIVEFPGILYRGNSEGKIRRWMIEQNLIEKVIAYEGGYFEDTAISTCCIVLNKHKQTTDITFYDHALDKSATVTLEEVAKNGYGLSVSNYVQPDEKRAEIDIDQINRQARTQFIERMHRELHMERTLCPMTGLDYQEFCQDIIRAVEEEMEGTA